MGKRIHLVSQVVHLPRAGDVTEAGSTPGLGRPPGGGRGYPLQHSCLENPTDRGAWWATVHGVVDSDMTEATKQAGMHNHCMLTLKQQQQLIVYPKFKFNWVPLLNLTALNSEQSGPEVGLVRLAGISQRDAREPWETGEKPASGKERPGEGHSGRAVRA